MASTRSKNTPGNYAAEQSAIAKQGSFADYTASSYYGVPAQSYFAGNGLVGMKTAHRNLSDNSCDIESFLRGIGSTDLVAPRADPVPEIKQMQSLNVCDRLPLIMPAPFVFESGQR
jgi:hypothetical protein